MVLRGKTAWAEGRPTYKRKRPTRRPVTHRAFSSYYCRQRPTLPHSFPYSTIGGIRLNFRVRNGNGCDPDPMTTGKLSCLGSLRLRSLRELRRDRLMSLSRRSAAGAKAESRPRQCQRAEHLNILQTVAFPDSL